MNSCPPIVELRQYTLLPGKRDVLIDLFDAYFVEGQEDAGMRVVGEFRVLDHPDRFFWLRGFANMESRRRSLETFYGGPIWRAHADAANATMIDSDNVLLLHPAASAPAFALGSEGEARGLLAATIYHPEVPVGEAFAALFESKIRPIASDAGARIVAAYATEYSENDFPRLPVRAVHSYAWFAAYRDRAAYDRAAAAIASDRRWNEVRGEFARLRNYMPAETWLLEPTNRSRLRFDYE